MRKIKDATSDLYHVLYQIKLFAYKYVQYVNSIK